EADALSAILTEVTAAGWNRIYDGWARGAAIAKSLSETGSDAASGIAVASSVLLQAGGATQARMPARPLHYLLVDLQSGFEQRGRLNARGRFDGVILRPQASYVAVYFDAVTFRAGAAFFTSRSAGQTTVIPGAPLARPPALADADGDGLSDLSELVLGTSAEGPDTDGDGVPDGAEVSTGTNPADGQPLGLGVVASRDTPGTAVEIDTANDFAVVADAASGLAVFDVSNPLDPVLLSQLDPPNATFDAVATAGNYVAAVPGASPSGVTIFGLSSDGVLLPVGSAGLGDAPEAVVAAGRYAYAPGRSSNLRTLAVVQLSTSRLVRHVPVPGGSEVTALAIDGDVLWALSGSRLLSFRRVGDDLAPLGELNLGSLRPSPLEPGPELTAGNGRVYVGDFSGFRVVDGSNPVAPVLLFEPATTQAAIHDFALSGSGLLLPVTSFSGTSTLSLSAYDVRNDRSTNFLTSFNTPGETRAVVLHRGYALTADGSAGMASVNFLAPDRGTNAPTVAIQPLTSHAAAGQEADELFFVSTTTADDVQVRDVEFYIDGQPAGLSGRFPFSTTLRAPAKTATRSSFQLRAKATDTGGNVGWSDAVTLVLLPDSTPPALVATTPAPGSTRPRGSVARLSATFDSEIDVSSLQAAWTLQGAGPDGTLGTADDVSVTGGRIAFDRSDRTASLQFGAPLPSGRYRSRLAGSVADLQGNPLGAEFTWDFSIPIPQALGSVPANQSVWLSDSLRRIEVRFDERLDAASVTGNTLGVFSTNRSNPLAIPGGVAFVSSDARGAVLEFAQPVPNGTYRVVFSPEIRDVYGSPVATNFPVTFMVKGPALWTNDLSGVWTGRTNWSAGAPPLLNDHVIIDRPAANPTISLRSSVTLTSFRSEEALVFDNFNGSLTVLDRAVFNGPLTMAVSGASVEGRFLEMNGSASLAGRLQIGTEAVVAGPASVIAGSLSLNGGRSRFLNRLDLRHHLNLGAHELTLEPGAFATLGDSQVGFGGANSRLTIAAGARLELTPTNTQFNAVSFVGNQGETGALVVNEGDFIKRGAATSFFVRMELLNT
ncbi:MAG: Ig-like domain-containing protein, partial [Verrucomicrobiales bacterium]|nr:Ig-like domain-containing protein [Verrucomicrobiales bacterium]